LFVSHNMASVQKLTSSSILLENGQLMESGRTDNVIEIYRNLSSKSLDFVYQAPERCEGFSKIQVHTSTKGNSHHFGEKLLIEFNLHFASKPINGGLTFQIINSEGRSVINPVIYDDNKEWSESGDVTIFAVIPKSRLVFGRYTITAHMGDKFDNRHIQSVEEVCAFEIVESTNYSAENWVPGSSIYIEDVNWLIN